MEQNILIAVGVFSIICVVCVAAIGLSMVKQNEKLKEKEKKYIEKIRQLEKILADEEIKVSDCGKVVNLKADKLKYEKYELNLEKSHLQKEVLYQKLRVESFGKYLEFDTVTKGSGYNTKVTLKESKDDKKTKKVILNVTE